MDRQTLGNRVEILEQEVESLEQLPDRVASLELQISQFRDEVRVAFSAVRSEMRQLHGTATSRMQELHEIATTQTRVLHEEVISRIAVLNDGLNGRRNSSRSRKRNTQPRSRKR